MNSASVTSPRRKRSSISPLFVPKCSWIILQEDMVSIKTPSQSKQTALIDIGTPGYTDERVSGQEGMGARTPLRRSGVGAQRGRPKAPHSATVRVAPVVLNSRSVCRLHAWRVILCSECHQDNRSATSWCVLQCNLCIIDGVSGCWVYHTNMDDIARTESG